MESELHYPNLVNCSITIVPAIESNISPPDDELDQTCLDVMRAPLPELYDFQFEKDIIQKGVPVGKNRDNPSNLYSTSASGDGISSNAISGGSVTNTSYSQKPIRFSDTEQAMIKRMKSVTEAKDEVCISILSEKGFELEESIEAYFSSLSG